MTLQKASLVDRKVCLHATSHKLYSYRPQTKFGVGQGNVFTPICDSFCSGEGVPSLGGGEGAILGGSGVPSLRGVFLGVPSFGGAILNGVPSLGGFHGK